MSRDNYPFKVNLSAIKDELDRYMIIDKETLYTDCIKKKLDCSLSNYNKRLALNARFVSTKPDRRVLKTLKRIQKNKDKEILNQNIAKNTTKPTGDDN